MLARLLDLPLLVVLLGIGGAGDAAAGRCMRWSCATMHVARAFFYSGASC